MQLDRIRNIGIVAHIDAGKTTVSERILFFSGIEHRMGEVHEGTAVMDWMEEERRRGITITAAATTVPWREHSIHLIDTPGHVDFTVEVERSMRVLDGAILVLSAVEGVQAQSETVWRQMQRHHVRSIAFVNQLDRAGADFFRCVSDLRQRLGANAVPIQFPVGDEREMRTVVDLLRREAWTYSEERLGKDPEIGPVPDAVRDEVEVLRSELVDALAEEDEALLEQVLDGREPDVPSLVAALRARVAAGTLVPVLAGAALRNVGVQALLDAVCDYLPSPAEVPPIQGLDPRTGEAVTRPPDAAGPLAALAFKLAADAHDDLVFARIYSGTLKPGAKVFNPRVGRAERITRLWEMHADRRNPLEEAGPGAIVALSGCRFTATGDSLSDHDQAIVFEAFTFDEPVITRVIEPESTEDRDKLQQSLERLAFEDPSLRVREDPETGQWLIEGMGELHLEVAEHRLLSEFRVPVRVGQPRVAYREAVRAKGRASATVDRVLGTKSVFGAIELEVAPVVGPTRVEWSDDVPVPEPFRAAITAALQLGGEVGPRFGYPLVGTLVRVVGGASQPDRDAEGGFTQAAVTALREALGRADVHLLEPLMSFEITTPADFLSGILGELQARSAVIGDVTVEGDLRTVRGDVPLSSMFGYASLLRSLSQGRASFALTPAGYRAVPEAELEARGLVWS
ncbi:MAG: elongation factor G [Planctomycetota bacterium]